LQGTSTIEEPGNASLIATSRAVATLPGLDILLGASVVHRWFARDISLHGGVIAWGRKPSAKAAQAFAERHRLNLLRLEDGFIRSVGLGNQEPPLSIVVDDSGIYYDATAPSRLEVLIASAHMKPDQSRAQSLIEAWRTARVSKYNHARDYEGKLPERYVLVADQTRGDASIRFGLAGESSFQRMLDAALLENPGSTVLLKVHPEVLAGRKQGHFDLGELTRNPRVKVLGEDVHPVSLIEKAEAIYVVTSQMGFEGLLWGKPVRTFGMPFYAGWGLTQDDLPAPERRKQASLEGLVYAALVAYPRYIDPESGKRCEVEQLIAWMGLQRRMRCRFPPVVYAPGFSIYKRPIVRSFFQGSTVKFVRRLEQVPEKAMLAIWGRGESVCLRPGNIEDKHGDIVRMEDGFIRSVGLGADLIRPLSWVMDSKGIYYDATRPSAVEILLQTASFDEALVLRAQRLRERLVAEDLTKYNLQGLGWQRPDKEVGSKRLVLVVGQVETDASLAYGALGIKRNFDLLCAASEANPEAYVIYKPHPDVVAGLRREGQGEEDVAQWCDEVVTDVAMGDLLSKVDEVHTLTSLAGFEALLRGKKVVCYGQPFYAGWGLTLDMLPAERRIRRLSLDELVAGALILYPTYISRTTGRFTTPEHTLDELLAWRRSSSARMPFWRQIYRFFVRNVLLRL